MKRIVGIAFLTMCIAFGALAEVDPVHLLQAGKDKDNPVEIEPGVLYFVEEIKSQQRWYTFEATESGTYTFYSERINGVPQIKVYNKYGETLWNKNLVMGTESVELVAGNQYTVFMRVYPPNVNFWFAVCSPSQHISYGSALLRKAATCETEGYMAQTCEYCGADGPKTIIAALGHHGSGMQTITPASCLQTGMDAECCINCGKVLSTIMTPVSEHIAGTWNTERAATCTADGYRVQLCTGCGKTMDSETVPAYGHSLSKWMEYGARCTIPGKRYRECTSCGAELEKEEIPAPGHTYSAWVETIAPTTSSTGLEIRECLSCGIQENRPVEKLTFLQGIFGR